MNFDLKDPIFAYIFGFIQTDGHLTNRLNNKGCLSIELQEKDKEILEKILNFLSLKGKVITSIRDTNFVKNYKSSKLVICDYNFRLLLNELGVEFGQKSEIVGVPFEEYSISDYWRGIIDGDGSLGLTSQNIPFISLTTKSEFLKNDFIDYIEPILKYRKEINLNKNNIYEISIFKESAQKIINTLYYENCLCLSRKKEKSKDALNWIRPNNMKIVGKREKWSIEEDEYLLTYGIEKSTEYLKRNKLSIKQRFWKLNRY